MVKTYSGHSLVSDVTPWWWAARWAERQSNDAVRRAIMVVASMRDDVEEIAIARSGVRVQFVVGDGDVEEVQGKADALRVFLDEMVRAPILAVAN
jgi:hypothetical protein